MKRFLSLFTLLLFLNVLSFGQAQRLVMIEQFTNASCPPCEVQNPAFNALLHANVDGVIALKYQTAFPGFDPMNQQNPTEVATRLAYYPGVTGVPTAAIDGLIPGDDYAAGLGGWDVAGGGYEGGPYGYNQAVLTFAGAQMTPITLELDHNISANLDSISITAKMKNVGVGLFNLADGVLQIAIIEKEIKYPSPPGSTAEQDFEDVMRKMLPDANGTALAAVMPGDSVEWNWTVALPDYIYNYNDIGVVGFVQDNSDKQVYQAARSEVKALTGDYADAGLASNTSIPTGLCEALYTPGAIVSNEGDAEITSFEISYSVNGSVAGTETWTGSLLPDSTVTYSFAEATAPGGNVSLTYAINEVNGARDINSLNNAAPATTFSTLSPTAIGTELLSSLETDALFDYPENSVAIPPIAEGEFGWGSFTVADTDHPFFTGATMGGYGTSQKSIWINYWQWNPLEANAEPEGSLIYDKIDLTDAVETFMTFDFAGAQYNAPETNDGLQVLASTDCGDTWTIVHDISGADFATVAPSGDAFQPDANTWATDTVDLSAYDGVAELNIQLKAISDWGNHHFLDNINVLAGDIVGIGQINLLEGKVQVFPNPTQSIANIEFELEEASVVDIKVYDVTGKLVETLLNQREFIAGKHIAVWKGTEDRGLYLVKINTQAGEITKKVTVF